MTKMDIMMVIMTMKMEMGDHRKQGRKSARRTKRRKITMEQQLMGLMDKCKVTITEATI